MIAYQVTEQQRLMAAAAIQAQCNGTFSPRMWHQLDICQGNCPHHPLVQPDHERFTQSLWGDWNEELYNEEHARETAAQTAKRLAIEAARDAAAKLEAEVIRQHLYATELAFRQSIGAKKVAKGAAPPARKLIEQPCKWLYAVPGVDGVFSNSPCAECWGHEYTDAKGVKLAPHKCQYIHQNQPEWKAEWNALLMTRDRWRAPKAAPTAAPAAAPARFAALAAAPAPKAKKNLPAGPSGW